MKQVQKKQLRFPELCVALVLWNAHFFIRVNGMIATFHYQCTQAMHRFTAGLLPCLPTALTFFQLDRSAGGSAGDS